MAAHLVNYFRWHFTIGFYLRWNLRRQDVRESHCSLAGKDFFVVDAPWKINMEPTNHQIRITRQHFKGKSPENYRHSYHRFAVCLIHAKWGPIENANGFCFMDFWFLMISRKTHQVPMFRTETMELWLSSWRSMETPVKNCDVGFHHKRWHLGPGMCSLLCHFFFVWRARATSKCWHSVFLTWSDSITINIYRKL